MRNPEMVAKVARELGGVFKSRTSKVLPAWDVITEYDAEKENLVLSFIQPSELGKHMHFWTCRVWLGGDPQLAPTEWFAKQRERVLRLPTALAEIEQRGYERGRKEVQEAVASGITEAVRALFANAAKAGKQ